MGHAIGPKLLRFKGGRQGFFRWTFSRRKLTFGVDHGTIVLPIAFFDPRDDHAADKNFAFLRFAAGFALNGLGHALQLLFGNGTGGGARLLFFESGAC